VGSIVWQTGQATSVVVFTLLDFVPGGGCASNAATVYETIAVISGPYAGSSAPLTECADLTNYPLSLTLTNVGPITI
jgi:hypothetical protein